MEVVNAVDDCGSRGARDAVVVGFADAAKSSDVMLDEEVLRQVRDAFFCDDEVGFQGDDGVGHGFHLLFFDLQDAVPVFFFRDFNVRLRLSLFVLQGAVKEDDTRILDAPPHSGVRDVFVKHDAVKDSAVFYLAPGDLLDFGVAFDVNFLLAASNVMGNCSDRFQG